MIQTDKPEIKVAILDLYDGIANEGMRGFQDILKRYKAKNELKFKLTKFLMCAEKCEVPDYKILIFIFPAVAPAVRLTAKAREWEKKYFNLIDKLEDHNLSNNPQKKHAFFVCHSFQLMCRKYQIG